jgi:ribosomal protein S20
VRDKERIDTALRTYRAAVDAGDATAAATAYERLRSAVKSAYSSTGRERRDRRGL